MHPKRDATSATWISSLNIEFTFASHFRNGDRIPVRTITRRPKHHWFGYYDKREFDPTNRFVLSNQVSFEHRTCITFRRAAE